MAHHPASNEADLPDDAPGTDSGASLIHVRASEQQAPGALRCCPVCGRPYTSASLPALPQPPAAAPGAAEAATPQPEPPGERLVLRCAHCGTYAVGVLAAQDDEHSETSGGSQG